MRIADHAVAMQSSQALQQPARVADQQQAISPESAKAVAAAEAEKQARQVNEQNKTEGRTIDNEERNRSGSGSPKKRDTGKTEAVEDRGGEPETPTGPDRSGHLDILI